MAEWEDDVIALGVRRFGENDAILDVFGRTRGRAAGLVYGGAGKRKRGLIEPGNTLHVAWRGRLEEQLGHFSVAEPQMERASRLFSDPLALAGLAAAVSILKEAAPEAEPKPGLYEAAEVLLDNLADPDIWPALFIRWEIGLLGALGYGLDLDRCALTGANDGLTHVSPRTGRAVRGSEAEDYLHKLLPLPAFLTSSGAPPGPDDLTNGFALTGYFMGRRLFGDLNKPLPEARYLMLERLERAGRLSLGSKNDTAEDAKTEDAKT